MLKKLIKYDFRSCWKKFRLLWAALLGLAVITGILVGRAGLGLFGSQGKAATPNAAAAGTVSTIVFSCFMCAAVVVAVMYVCDEFYNGLLGSRGYLMFSLPVKTSSLILSKGIVAVLMETISCLTAVLSIFLMAAFVDPGNMADVIRKIWQAITTGDLLAHAPGGLWLFLLECVILFIFTAALFNAEIHAAISLGHLAKKNRSAWALIIYFGLSALGTLIPIKLSDWGVAGSISKGIMRISAKSTLFRPDMTESILFVLIIILGEAAATLVFYFVEKYVLEHKLNLE